LRILVRIFTSTDFKVYGLVAHPRTVVHLLRLLNTRGF
jgi:hypothetical protein